MTATTTAALGAPCRFRCASAFLSLRSGQELAVGKLGQYGCAPGPWTGCLWAGGVVDGKRDVMARALSRINPRFIIYHSQASDGRDLGGNRPRPEQTLPLEAIWLYAFSALCYSPDCSYSILIYAPSAWCEPRPPAPAGKTRLNHHPPSGTTRWIKAQGWASAPHWVGQRVRAICTPPGDRRVAFPTSCRAQSQLPPNR